MNELQKKIDSNLWSVWAGALDTYISEDYRLEDGALDEEKYLKAKENIIAYFRKETIDAVIAALPKRHYSQGHYYSEALKEVTAILQAAKESK